MLVLKVSMLEGRTPEQKAELIRRLTDSAAQHLGEPADSIRVLIYDMSPQNWGAGGITIEMRNKAK
jgi:4-oxalocrotonate tautomerase